jgi:hypothetical protein
MSASETFLGFFSRIKFFSLIWESLNVLEEPAMCRLHELKKRSIK